MYRNVYFSKLQLLQLKYGNQMISSRFSSASSFYQINESKNTSKHDYYVEIDENRPNKLDRSSKPNTVMGFLRSPEYQLLKSTTPTPAAILDSFYNYSPSIKLNGASNLKLERWGNVELSGYHKITDFLWYLGINKVINKQDIERFSHNFSISELNPDDVTKLILVFENFKGPLNICSLVMYEHLFHEKPITTQELVTLALALGKVKHSVDTLTLPLISILHEKPLRIDERIKLFLAVSRLESTINLIEFYTFSHNHLQSYNDDELKSLLRILSMDRWESDIRNDGYIDQYNLDDYKVSLSPLQILQILNGISNISLEWLIGSVHKRIELKRLWNSKFGKQAVYQDKLFSYRIPLVAFCKILLNYLDKLELDVEGFYIIEKNSTNLPIYGVALAHVMNLIDEIRKLSNVEISCYSNISSTVHRLTPSGILDIIEFIKPFKHNYVTLTDILQSFIANMEKTYNIIQDEHLNRECEEVGTCVNNKLNSLREIIEKMAKSNQNLKDKLTVSYERLKYIAQKVNAE